jgi:hypothetical protein
MDPPIATSHSFIVKVWVEQARSARRGATWRGHITHVPSGDRVYVDELDAIALFIAPRLAGLGVRLGYLWNVRGWLINQKRRLRRTDAH